MAVEKYEHVSIHMHQLIFLDSHDMRAPINNDDVVTNGCIA